MDSMIRSTEFSQLVHSDTRKATSPNSCGMACRLDPRAKVTLYKALNFLYLSRIVLYSSLMFFCGILKDPAYKSNCMVMAVRVLTASIEVREMN